MIDLVFNGLVLSLESGELVWICFVDLYIRCMKADIFACFPFDWHLKCIV